MKSKKEMIIKEMQHKAYIRSQTPNTEEQPTVNSGNTTSCIHSFFKSVKQFYDTFSRIQPEPNNHDYYPF